MLEHQKKCPGKENLLIIFEGDFENFYKQLKTTDCAIILSLMADIQIIIELAVTSKLRPIFIFPSVNHSI